MEGNADGQVHKVISVVATSDSSWEDATRAGVDEAVKTVHDLRTATVVEADLVVREGAAASYRVKLEMSFQLDRSRRSDGAISSVTVRRYLIIANQTLPSPGLHELIDERASANPSEFHILVPEAPPAVIYNDPHSTFDHHLAETGKYDRLIAEQEANERLDSFKASFAHLGPSLTGEVGVGDPVSATRRVMDRATFDEIIVSTLPIGISRWVRLDLPARLKRSFHLPVTHLEQDRQ